MDAKQTTAELTKLLAERILGIDGALGTMVQAQGLEESSSKSHSKSHSQRG